MASLESDRDRGRDGQSESYGRHAVADKRGERPLACAAKLNADVQGGTYAAVVAANPTTEIGLRSQ